MVPFVAWWPSCAVKWNWPTWPHTVLVWVVGRHAHTQLNLLEWWANAHVCPPACRSHKLNCTCRLQQAPHTAQFRIDHTPIMSHCLEMGGPCPMLFNVYMNLLRGIIWSFGRRHHQYRYQICWWHLIFLSWPSHSNKTITTDYFCIVFKPNDGLDEKE